MSETTYFNDQGILVTNSEVHVQAETYATQLITSNRTQCVEELEPDPEKTSRRRGRVLKAGLLVTLLLGVTAGWQYQGTVQEYFAFVNGQALSVWTARAVGFGIAGGLALIALLGVILIIRVDRSYKLYHVYLGLKGVERKIASSRNEAWVARLTAALDQAAARQAFAAEGRRAEA